MLKCSSDKPFRQGDDVKMFTIACPLLRVPGDSRAVVEVCLLARQLAKLNEAKVSCPTKACRSSRAQANNHIDGDQGAIPKHIL